MTGTRSRTVLRAVAWVASGVIAGGLVAGVGYAHADHTGTPTAVGSTTAADDLLGQMAGLSAADPTTPAPDAQGTTPRQKLRDLMRNRMLGKRIGGLAGRMLHGEVTVQTKDGVQTFLIQRGTVTSVGGDSVTVKSSDGFTRTWKVDPATKFGKAGRTSLGQVKAGDAIGLVGLASDHPTAKALRARAPQAASGSTSSGPTPSTGGTAESSGTVTG